MNFNVAVALNNLSFGFCSYNILREMYNRGLSPHIFPIGDQVDLAAFDKTEQEFALWLQSGIQKARKSYKKTNPCFRLWHCFGSETSQSTNQVLMVFHETDEITPTEANILNNQNKVLVTSQFTKEVFEQNGVENVVYCPLGFDSLNFKKLPNRAYPKETVCLHVGGKFEYRKRHKKVIQALAKKFANRQDVMIHLQVYNPFFDENTNKSFLGDALGGAKPWNFNILPYVQKLSELNHCLNSADIVCSMSGGEGFDLIGFHALALGKHGVVHNATAMKDWANDKNAVMVQSNTKIPCYDNVFFYQGRDHNQGNFWDFDEDEFLAAVDVAIARYWKNPVNEEGLKLQKEFTWARTVDIILENLK